MYSGDASTKKETRMSSSEARRQREWLEAKAATLAAQTVLNDAIEAVVIAKCNEKEKEAQLMADI